MPHTRILYSALLFFVSLVLFAQNPSTEAFSDLIGQRCQKLKTKFRDAPLASLLRWQVVGQSLGGCRRSSWHPHLFCTGPPTEDKI